MSDPNVHQILSTGNDQFTAKMFQEVTQKQADKSCVLSAFSVLSPLAQLALASVGPSQNEIFEAIGMPDENITKQVFSDVNKRLQQVKGVELKQASKVYVRDGYSLNDEFATVSRNVFNLEIQNINFNRPQEAADEINTWVEDHTNKRIKKLVDPSVLIDETVAILVNTIYFKGSWKIPFFKNRTLNREFFVSKDEKVIIPIMHQTNHFKYGVSSVLDAKLLELQYDGDETSFVIILPNKYNGIDSLIEKLKDPEAFSKGLETMYFNKVEIFIPKFKIETTTDLKEVLQNMNIRRLFQLHFARLDNLIKDEEYLFISDATQKAFIEVNEEGAEAAVAMFAVANGISSQASKPLIFNADHPFVFFLMEKNNILFNGVFRS